MIENTHRASSSSQRLEQTRRAQPGAVLLVLTRLGCREWESGYHPWSQTWYYIRGLICIFRCNTGDFSVIFLFGGFLALSVKRLFRGNEPYFIVQVTCPHTHAHAHTHTHTHIHTHTHLVVLAWLPGMGFSLKLGTVVPFLMISQAASEALQSFCSTHLTAKKIETQKTRTLAS